MNEMGEDNRLSQCPVCTCRVKESELHHVRGMRAGSDHAVESVCRRGLKGVDPMKTVQRLGVVRKKKTFEEARIVAGKKSAGVKACKKLLERLGL